MKSRIGFVSNSSSASFVIDCSKITGFQKLLILAFNASFKAAFGKDPVDGWSVKYNPRENTISGFTMMDNYDEANKLFDALDLRASAVSFDFEG